MERMSGISRILAALSIGLLAACGDSDSGPLKVHAGQWPGYQPFFLAETLGYYDGAGIELVELANPSQSLNAFRNGSVHTKTVTLDEALMMLQDGLDIRVLAVLHYTVGLDTAVLAQPGITRMQDLAGKRVGVEKLTNNAYILARALAFGGLSEKDIRPVFLAEDEHEQAFRDKRVDAVVAYGPTLSRLLADGATPLFDTSQIPGEIVDILVVHADAAEGRREAVKKLVAGWYRAIERTAADPEGSTAIMTRRIAATAGEFQATMDALHFPDRNENRALLTSPDGIEKSARRMMEIMVRHSLLKETADTSRLFDRNLIRAIHGP